MSVKRITIRKVAFIIHAYSRMHEIRCCWGRFDGYLPRRCPCIHRDNKILPTEPELTWEIDFEKKIAKCDVAEVGFYEYQDGGYGVSFVRLLNFRRGVTEIQAARSAQQAINQAAEDTSRGSSEA